MASTPFFSSSFVHCPGRWRKPVLCFIHIIQAPAIGSALECKGPGKRLRRRSRRARPGAIQDPPFRISTKAGKDTGEKPENRKQKSEVRRQPRHRRRRIEQPVTKRRRRRRRTASGRNFDGGGGY